MEPIKLIPLHSGRAEVWSNGAENLSAHLTYDISNYLKAWPDAQPSVAFERADGEKYAHVWHLEGAVLHIPLLLADTEKSGVCKCMITLTSGDGRTNTIVFYGSVTEGIDSLGEAPTEPMLGVIEQVNAAAARAEAAAGRAQTGGGGGASKYQQPDWGSETAEDYIYPEMTLTGEGGQFLITTPPLAETQFGNVVTVRYNGTDYECSIVDAAPLIGVAGIVRIFGNLTLLGIEGGNADAPFVIMYMPIPEDGAYGQIMGMDETATSVTFSVKGPVETVHPIPEKYTPIMRVTLSAGLDGNLTASKTYAQIVEALEAGTLVYVYMKDTGTSGFTGTSVQWVESAIIFYVGLKTVLINHDNTVNVHVD